MLNQALSAAIHILRFLLLIATGTLPIRDGRMGREDDAGVNNTRASPSDGVR